MRQLRLETPPMRGTDVTDWQTFLIHQGLFSAAANGIFDAATAAASSAYQTKRGFARPDGVVGPFTLARAIEDGLTSATTPFQAGMDANVNCAPFATQIAAAGIRFVARYYSRTTSKILTPAEARALSGAGLQMITVYEDHNDKLQFFNAAIGSDQARRALTQAAAIGQPNGSAIYFAADFDPAPADVSGPVMEYFHAVHDVMADSPYLTGIYGSGLTCRMIRDAGFARFTWLAQSTGFLEYRDFMAQADIVQAVPARDLIPHKLNIDDDIAQSPDFGAFHLMPST